MKGERDADVRGSLANALCVKFGYGTDMDKFKREASDRFSLLKDGTLDQQKCARLLLVNVREFSFTPFEEV